MRLGENVPDFSAETTHGRISFHEWLGDCWGVLLSHPSDFGSSSSAEVGRVARLKHDFAERNAKVIGVSVEPQRDHNDSRAGPERNHIFGQAFPLIADPERKVSRLYGMIHPAVGDSAPVRIVFVVGPDKRLRLTHVYPQSNGRDFQEIIGVIDSLQLTAGDHLADAIEQSEPFDVARRVFDSAIHPGSLVSADGSCRRSRSAGLSMSVPRSRAVAKAEASP
jgi:alkyl hydroperoxide reductase subunit AhpC